MTDLTSRARELLAAAMDDRMPLSATILRSPDFATAPYERQSDIHVTAPIAIAAIEAALSPVIDGGLREKVKTALQGSMGWPHDLHPGPAADAVIPLIAPIAPVLDQGVREARVLEALTPSEETKAAYWGEFSWTEWLPDKDGIEQGYERVVPWTTIKEIMRAIRERADLDLLDETDCLAALTNDGVEERTGWPFQRGDRVNKVKGLPFGAGDAMVLACYQQPNGDWRVVVAHPEGWQHIFAPDQLSLAALQSGAPQA
jgi:hypothetical protein